MNREIRSCDLREYVRLVALACSASLLLLLPACASVPPAAAPPTPFVLLQKEAEGEYWRATWHLPKPVRELAFEREGTAFRSDVFEVVTPGFSVEREGDREVLRSSGALSDRISVRFLADDRELAKEYEFFQKFTDGSIAIYTGHLVARADGDCDECFIRRFRFEGPSGSDLVLNGKIEGSPLEWNDMSGQGTYVYFGGITPVVSPDVIAVVDPGMPEWLASEAADAFPQLFRLYAHRLGVQPPERPTVLFNFKPGEQPGYSTSGGTLPGLIQLTVEGNEWRERSDEALLHLMHFLAHEAVHIWNGEVVRYPGSADAWMHEGSADALAQRTLLEIGLIDEPQFLGYQTTAVNECRKGLGGFPLRQAAERRQFPLYYSCGNALALMTESAMPEGDLFDFWKTLIARTIDSGEYGVEDYLQTWRALGAGEDDVDELRHFVESAATADAVVSMLSRRGVGVTAVTDPPEEYGQSVSRSALFALLGDQCTGRYGFRVAHEGYALSEALQCREIPAGGGTITHIGGFHVLREGHAAWDAMSERCGTSDRLSLTLASPDGASQQLSVECRKPLDPRPEYLRITSRQLR